MIVVTDRRHCIRPLPEQLDLACEASPEMIILREKDLPSDELLSLAYDCLQVCDRHDVPLVINGDMDVARELDICRIHVSFDTMCKGIPCDFSMVGVSVHSMYEAMKAEDMGADYLIAGHIFETASKSTTPRGMYFLRDICDAVDIPVYAIGGIGPDNYYSLFDCGAMGGCCMSSVMNAEDPAAFIRSMYPIK